jgi:tyrosyl-tRNA synthetase
MDLYSEFAWRGLVYDATDGTREALGRDTLTGYIGFDPTAASLHVGSLLPMIALAHLQRAGHSPIAVVGGGTGLIGDPSGKAAERQLLTTDQVAQNVEGIRAQLARFLDFDSTAAPARLVDNAEWLTKLGAVEFMRDVGKHFTVNAMLAKESVKRRIDNEEGISYTEFSYSLLQAYDFLELFDRFHCTLQLGGSDQWGNIVAGIDLIRRVRGGKAHGLVMPLITTAAGTKFGKTEAGTVWLDPALTTPYEFYQFWLNADDRDAVKYLKFFTFLPQDGIAALEHASAAAPEKRIAQRELAREVTRLVHGDRAVADAEAAAAALFTQSISALTLDQIRSTLGNVPAVSIPWAAEWAVADLLAAAGVTASKGEATRLIRGGGIYINDRRLTDEKERLRPDLAIEGQVFVVRKGKKDNFLVKIVR